MSEDHQETREEEVARVRSYLASQSMRRAPLQLLETLQQAQGECIAALNAFPEQDLYLTPSDGEWSAIDVLSHMRTMAAFDLAAIGSVLEKGEAPPAIQDILEAAPAGATKTNLLHELTQLREQLFSLVQRVDPSAHLDITWNHAEFGAMHWREWLLFARVHTLDHTRQLQAISAILRQEGEREI
jgi:hypothetical protein